MNPALAYAAGLPTLPLLAGSALAVRTRLSRDRGTGACDVCGRGEREPGAHSNAAVWAARAWHRIVWASRPAHRRAWAAHQWNPKNR